MGCHQARPWWFLHTTSSSPYLTCCWWNQGTPTLWGDSVWNESNGGAIKENNLFPVKRQWHASLHILIHLFYNSLHIAERERWKERGKEGRKKREREEKREASEMLKLFEDQFKFAIGIRQLHNGKIMIDMCSVSYLKDLDYLRPESPHSRELLHTGFLSL